MAWQYISSEMSVKGFKMCCMSNVADEIDDDMFWNGKWSHSQCLFLTEDEGTDCEDGDSVTDW